MNESTKPDIKFNEIMILSIESINGLVESLSYLLFPKGLNANEVNSPHSVEMEENELSIPFHLSKIILRILVILLEKSIRDISIQSLLNSIQVYINMTGIKNMRKERDAFIRELCIFAA